MDETVRVSLRIPKDYAMWLEREVQAKKEKGYRSSITDEILTCIAHRIISMMPSAKRRNLCAALAGNQTTLATGDRVEEHQDELIPETE